MKPYFDGRTGQIHEKDYWKFSDKRLESYESIATFERVLFHAFTSKHLAFGFVKTGVVYSAPHVVVALQGYEHFAVLQSSFHLLWVIEICSTMGVGIRYAPSDLLDTFPFPDGVIDSSPASNRDEILATVGRAYYDARSKYMRTHGIGLTDFYSKFHDPNERSEAIENRRILHSSVDQELCMRYSIGIQLKYHFAETKIGIRYLPSTENRSTILSHLGALNSRCYQQEVCPRITEYNFYKVNTKD